MNGTEALKKAGLKADKIFSQARSHDGKAVGYMFLVFDPDNPNMLMMYNGIEPEAARAVIQAATVALEQVQRAAIAKLTHCPECHFTKPNHHAGCSIGKALTSH